MSILHLNDGPEIEKKLGSITLELVQVKGIVGESVILDNSDGLPHSIVLKMLDQGVLCIRHLIDTTGESPSVKGKGSFG